MKNLFTILFLFLSGFIFGQTLGCPTSHTVETVGGDYHIRFDNIPLFSTEVLVDTSNDGVFDLAMVFEGLEPDYTYSVPVGSVSPSTTFYQLRWIFGVNIETCFYGQVLPIELTDFSSELKKDKILVNWSTASELNNDYFLILNNGETVGRVEGAGTTDEVQKYSFEFTPLEGFNYVSLRQVDFNGESTDSDYIAILYRPSGGGKIIPINLSGQISGRSDFYIQDGKLKIIIRE